MVPPGIPGGRYRLDSHIATGGMGEVWRGTDLVLQRDVAVKLLKQEYARDPDASARFRNEARHAGVLSHPNIAQVFDFSDEAEDGQPYLVMELVDGPSLNTLLADGPVGPAFAMAVTAQVSAGLAAAHEAGLVHRDIKPANLLISKDGLVKITDFGIAHAAGVAPVTPTREIVGTVAYLAPERATDALAGPPVDLYALGVVLYECLTGEQPFTGAPLAVAMARRERPLPALPPDVPEGIAALVTDLTAKDPGARPGTAAEVATRAERLHAEVAGATPVRADLPVLKGAAVGVGVSAGPGPLAPEPARRHGLFGWIGPRNRAGLAAAAIILAGLAGWALLGLENHTSHARAAGGTHPTAQPITHSSPSRGSISSRAVPAVAPEQASSTPLATLRPAPTVTKTRTESPARTPARATTSRPPSPARSSPSPSPSSPSPSSPSSPTPSPSPTTPQGGSGSSGPSIP